MDLKSILWVEKSSQDISLDPERGPVVQEELMTVLIMRTMSILASIKLWTSVMVDN